MKIIPIFLLFLFFDWNAVRHLSASDLRLAAMGDMRLAVPDERAQLNLFQFADNTAFLKFNDSLNWARYSYVSGNEWGNLRRYWDAEAWHLNALSFSSQKHLGHNQIFYGQVRYTIDNQRDVRQAIEQQPYAPDPFVLADSTSGNIEYYGPQVQVAFSQKITSCLLLGASLDYGISRGLKKIYTTPEIISTTVAASLDVAYLLNPFLTLGLSFRPAYIKDIIKMEIQSDGSLPEVFRYRGEFEFSRFLGTGQRTATFKNYEWSPQIAWRSARLEGALAAGYFYQWHEVFDGEMTRIYEGYYQGEHYFADLAARFFPDREGRTTISLGYQFRYVQDWAKEPTNDLLIYRAFYRRHRQLAGLSHFFEHPAILMAIEFLRNYDRPEKDDYLAHRYRSGEMELLEWHVGFETDPRASWRLRGGWIYQVYHEDKVWNYFGNYRGPAFTGGLAYHGRGFEFDLAVKYGQMNVFPHEGIDVIRRREKFEFKIDLKRFLTNAFGF